MFESLEYYEFQYYLFQEFVDKQMRLNWEWLMSILDSTEAQLRFGSALSSASDPGGSSTVGMPAAGLPVASRTSRTSSERSSFVATTAASGTTATSRPGIIGANSDPSVTRRDFLNYALSLMRAHSSEHSDSLPVLDVSALKHVAYVLDALVFCMRAGTDKTSRIDAIGTLDPGTLVQQAHKAAQAEARQKRKDFFKRTDSTLCLGCPPCDPYTTPLSEALPLADQPQLLTPTARREELFGIARNQLGRESDGNSIKLLPTKLSLSTRGGNNDFNLNFTTSGDDQVQEEGAASRTFTQSMVEEGEDGGYTPEDMVLDNSEAPSSNASNTGDTASVRSVEGATSAGGSERRVGGDDEPQDLSMKGDDAVAGSSGSVGAGEGSNSQDIFSLVQLDEPGSSRPQASSGSSSSFTSPKKMMLLREAARESERMEIEDDRLATLAGVASQLVDSKSDSAPEILVVPNTC